MNIRSFDELTNMEIDTLREIGSIGTRSEERRVGKECRL